MSNKLISVNEFCKKAANKINNRYKARKAFWDVALGNNSKLANLAKLAIQEAEDESKREPLTDEQVDIVIEQTEIAIGHAHNAWDMVDQRELVRAVLKFAHGIKG